MHHSVFDLKATPMNVQRSLIREFTPYVFELSHNAAKTTKKRESAVYHSAIIKWFKKFSSSCKNFDEQAKSDRPKIRDPEVVLQAKAVREYQAKRIVHHVTRVVQNF